VKLVRDERGFVGAILLIIVVVAIGAAIWYATKYAKAHPASTTDLITPSTNDASAGGQAIKDAKQLQNKYQPATPEQ